MSFASQRFHLVGVGGSGMSGLARLLRGMQCEVSGSDATESVVLASLRDVGAAVWAGTQPEAITGEGGYVIRSAAVPEASPEVQECVRRGFTSLLYAEAVGRRDVGFLSPFMTKVVGHRAEPLSRSLRVCSDHFTASTGWAPHRAVFDAGWLEANVAFLAAR